MVITIACPSCHTSFPVDPAKIPDGGVKVRCSACAHVFRVEKPVEVPAAWGEEPEHAGEAGVPDPAEGAEPPAMAGGEGAGAGPGLDEGRRVLADDAPDWGPGTETTEAPDEAEPSSWSVDLRENEPWATPGHEEDPASAVHEERWADAGHEEDPASAVDEQQWADAIYEVPATEGEVEAATGEVEAAAGDPTEAGREPTVRDPAEGDATEPRAEEDDSSPQPAVERDSPEHVAVERDAVGRDLTREEPDAGPAVATAGPDGLESREGVPAGSSVEDHTSEDANDAPPAIKGFTLGRRDPSDKARRLARVLVSDMIMYNAERHRTALEQGTLLDDFEEEIEKSWKEFVDQVGSEMAEGEGRGYWVQALNDILAKGQPLF